MPREDRKNVAELRNFEQAARGKDVKDGGEEAESRGGGHSYKEQAEFLGVDCGVLAKAGNLADLVADWLADAGCDALLAQELHLHATVD